MELIIVIGALLVLAYVGKSYLSYHQENPYRKKEGEYNRPFQTRTGGNIYDEVLQSEYGLIVAMMAKVVKADGNICTLEQEIIDTTLDELAGYFSHKVNARKILEEILEKEEREHDNIAMIATEFINYTRTDPNKRIKIMEFLINLSFADKQLSESEEETLGKIAFYFKIPAAEYHRLLESFKEYYAHYSAGSANPYQVLGVDETVSAAELKSVYRRLGEEFVVKATARLQEINDAYEAIKRAKGY